MTKTSPLQIKFRKIAKLTSAGNRDKQKENQTTKEKKDFKAEAVAMEIGCRV